MKRRKKKDILILAPDVNVYEYGSDGSSRRVTEAAGLTNPAQIYSDLDKESWRDIGDFSKQNLLLLSLSLSFFSWGAKEKKENL